MAGFSNIAGDESIMFADNASFDGTERGGKLTTNGQLWIGSTSSPHVKIGTITSPDGSLAIGYTSPNITLSIAPSGPVVQTLSDDVATLITPISNNIQLQGHVVEQGATKFSTVVAGTHLAKINPMSASRWIVDPLGFNGTHTTIASALTSATSGDTIFLLPGTYTENPTLKAGVNIAAYGGDGYTPTVTISGKCTMTTAGTVTISGVRLQTNSDFFLAVTGSANSNVNLVNCYLNCLNNTGISYTSSGTTSHIICTNCSGDIGTTGISLIAATGSGTDVKGAVKFNNVYMTNSGSSVTPSTTSACTIICKDSNVPMFQSTSTGGLFFHNCTINDEGVNAIGVDCQGSVQSELRYCRVNAGTSAAINIGGSGTMINYNSVLGSSNTNAVTGTGAYKLGFHTCNQTDTVVNTVTSTAEINRWGISKSTQQPAFVAFQSSNVSNKTGNAASYTVIFDTVTKDQNSNYNNTTGVFTAPFTGVYVFTTSVQTTSIATTATKVQVQFIVSSITTPPQVQYPHNASLTNWNAALSATLALTAADTVSVNLIVTGMPGNTVGVHGGASDYGTFFSGYMLC